MGWGKVSLTKKVISDQRLEGGKGVNHEVL